VSVFRIPSTPKATDELVHWWAMEHSPTWNTPITVIACGADADTGHLDANAAKVTCPTCLTIVVRRRCLALEDVPGPLPRRCGLQPHIGGLHDWEIRDRSLLSQIAHAALTDGRPTPMARTMEPEPNTPSERLPVIARWPA